MKITKSKTSSGRLALLVVAIFVLITTLPAVALSNTMIHNSTNLGSSYWVSGGWGIVGGEYGEFTCGTCHARNTGNIKRVKQDLVAPNSPGEKFPIQDSGNQVNLQDAQEGSSDFGDDSVAGKIADGLADNETDKICESCHTQTKFHNYDATQNVVNDPVDGSRDHYNQADCMICHPHNQGFKPQACDSCHGYPPTTTGVGGPTGLSNDPFTTASTNAGSHQTHALDLGYACTNCHDSYTMPQESAVKTGFGDISIGFNNFGSTTGSYAGQANVSYNDVLGSGAENCTNVYCHSTVQSTDGDSSTPSAYSSPSWGGTAACGTCHAGDGPGTGSHAAHINDGADCNSCHNDAVSATTVPTGVHVDGTINVYNSATGDLGYTAGGAPGNGYGTCDSTNCHDQGRGGLATTPTWGTSVTDCSECHASAPATGGHTVHLAASVAGTTIACADCHDAATDPSTETAPASEHRDTNIDVSAGSYPTNKAKNSAFATCTTASCHRAGLDTVAANDYTVTSAWDQDDANCTQCHAAVPATGSHNAHVVTAGSNCSACHTNALKDDTYNDAAHIDSNIDVAVGSYTANKAYKSAYLSCSAISCHSDGLTGATGTSPVWGVASGCAACHEETMTTGSHTAHLSDGATCNNCHLDAVEGSNAPTGIHALGTVNVYNSVVGDLGYPNAVIYGSSTWTTCNAASCHADGIGNLVTTPDWGDSAVCVECHTTMTTNGPATGGSHAKHMTTSLESIGCDSCHASATDFDTDTEPNFSHRDGDIDVMEGYPTNKTIGSAYATCSNAKDGTMLCHDNGLGTVVPSPTWGAANSDCSTCHLKQPDTGSHTGHLNAGAICSNCHNGAVEGATASTQHGDANVDVYNSAVGDLGYTQDAAKGSGTWTTCTTASCHRAGLDAVIANDYTETPAWGQDVANCTQCHAAVPATGSHTKHLSSGATCSNCHLDAVEGSDAPTGIHALGTVNVYNSAAGDLGYPNAVAYGSSTWTTCNAASCHDDGTGTLVTTPDWGDSAACVECHTTMTADGPATGSHAIHLTTTLNTSMDCRTCHIGNPINPTTDEVTGVNHRDGNIDVAEGYPSNKTKGSAYATCTSASDGSLLCHDNGRGTTVASPTWGIDNTDCSTCHEKTMSSGSHTGHLNAGAICSNCHNGAVEGTTASTQHGDFNVDVYNSTVGDLGYTQDAAKGDGTWTTCTTASCHRAGLDAVIANDYIETPTWGQDGDNCTQCHLASPTTGSHTAHIVDASYNCDSCHTNALKDTSYNDAAHFDTNIDVAVGNYITNRTNQTYNSAYVSCDNISCHGDGLNVGGGDTPVWGDEAGCAACHDTVNDDTGSHTKHLAYTSNSCVECHDDADISTENAPAEHGDGNVDVYNSAALDLGYPVNVLYNSASWTTCSAASCHDDGRSANTTPDWGTAAANSCAACHDAIPATGSHASHVADAAVSCTNCHAGAVQITTKPTDDHDDGDIDTTAAHGYSQNKDKGSAFETCSTASCHNDGRNSGLTDTWGTTLNNCSECHATAPTTGSHTTHLATYACATCHTGTTQGTTAGAGHRDGNITTAASTGLGAKVKGTAFTSCSTNNCHGSGSPTWGTDLSANDECTQCHGEMVATASDAQKAPGGSGVDTNGDSLATDAQVGAHQIHLNPTYSSAVACTACHTVPAAITDAGHIDSALPAELNFSGLALGGLDGQSAATPTNSQAGCATTYCHDSSKIKHAYGGTGAVTPDWDVPNLVGNVSDCDNCHGYPPAGAHSGFGTNCSDCHTHVVGTDDGFNDSSLHINGTVEGSSDNCSNCHATLPGSHSAHVDSSYFLAGKTISGGDYGKVSGSGTNNYGWYEIDYIGNGQPLIGCGQCHPDTQASHPSGGAAEIDLDGTDDAASPLNQGPKPLNSSPSYASNKCSNVYCHSNGVAGALVFDATPPAWGTDTITCNGCHGNSPTTNAHNLHEVGIHYENLLDDDRVGLMAKSTTDIGLADGTGGDYGAGAAHGDSALSSTLTCNTCHKDSVADSANAGNTTCTLCHIDSDSIITGNELARNSWQHLNGQVDVSFAALSTFKSKAQLRNDITAVAEVDASWARYNAAGLDNTAYKLATGNGYDMAKNAVPIYNSADLTCSTVDCHNGIKTPEWDSTSDNCMSCHTELPQ